MLLKVQDPVWVNYDIDGHQVQLDSPLLSSMDDINWEMIQYHWQINCLLTNLRNVMFNYVNVLGCFMDLKYLVNGLATRFSSLSCLSHYSTDEIEMVKKNPSP